MEILSSQVDDTATNNTGTLMMAAIAAAAPTTGTPAERLLNFKALVRQAVGKLASGATDTMDFGRTDLAAMVPDIATTLPATITTIKAIKSGAKRTLTAAEISGEAILLIHDTTGTSTADVELSVAGSTITWRVTKIWDTESGKYIKTLRGHSFGVLSVAWNGPVLASVCRDKTIKIWDTESGECAATLKGHSDRVNLVAWNGKLLASGSDDRTLRIWKFPPSFVSQKERDVLVAVRQLLCNKLAPDELFRGQMVPLLLRHIQN